MPDFDGLTYPNASEVPDGPGAFLQLIQSLSTRLNAIVGARQIQTWRKSTLALLNAVSGAVEGDRGYVTSGAERGGYTRFGSSWVADDTGWKGVTLNSGWTDVGFPARYRRLNGVVYFKGRATRSSGTLPAFTLPAEFCPPESRVFVLDAGGTPTRSVVESDGRVGPVGGTTITSLAFDGVPPYPVV